MNMYRGAFLGPYCCAPPPMQCGLFECIIMCLLDTVVPFPTAMTVKASKIAKSSLDWYNSLQLRVIWF